MTVIPLNLRIRRMNLFDQKFIGLEGIDLIENILEGRINVLSREQNLSLKNEHERAFYTLIAFNEMSDDTEYKKNKKVFHKEGVVIGPLNSSDELKEIMMPMVEYFEIHGKYCIFKFTNEYHTEPFIKLLNGIEIINDDNKITRLLVEDLYKDCVLVNFDSFVPQLGSILCSKAKSKIVQIHNIKGISKEELFHESSKYGKIREIKMHDTYAYINCENGEEEVYLGMAGLSVGRTVTVVAYYPRIWYEMGL
ncbi:hypothetical protein TCON_1388 [Astathelohania contejeani]|uniref:Uncharacterized protein n=1 Tax=Astathelohania contejeani TaxID=164912 RepID=A0ABQ7HYX8_9MICR|nr:hypothetical protein TCON_1388 [Thelohania contejeani]